MTSTMPQLDAETISWIQQQARRENHSAEQVISRLITQGVRAERQTRPRLSRYSTPEELAEGYRQMATDLEQEQEALEWCEALVGDVAYEP